MVHFRSIILPKVTSIFHLKYRNVKNTVSHEESKTKRLLWRNFLENYRVPNEH